VVWLIAVDGDGDGSCLDAVGCDLAEQDGEEPSGERFKHRVGCELDGQVEAGGRQRCWR
jgi:hypothetical protein